MQLYHLLAISYNIKSNCRVESEQRVFIVSIIHFANLEIKPSLFISKNQFIYYFIELEKVTIILFIL